MRRFHAFATHILFLVGACVIAVVPFVWEAKGIPVRFGRGYWGLDERTAFILISAIVIVVAFAKTLKVFLWELGSRSHPG
ncbi:MAG TPA: hypothetical protein PJ982_07780, partial [Lacipirellulaceae bacterium]|nr:hypothetical protein [Lacipirellulaceae bacterium]